MALLSILVVSCFCIQPIHHPATTTMTISRDFSGSNTNLYCCAVASSAKKGVDAPVWKLD